MKIIFLSVQLALGLHQVITLVDQLIEYIVSKIQ